MLLDCEIIDDDDPAALCYLSPPGGTGDGCCKQDLVSQKGPPSCAECCKHHPAVYMLTADNDDVPVSGTSTSSQTQSADPWEREDPWSRSGNEQVAAARTAAHARWQGARSSINNGEGPHAATTIATPPAPPVPQGASGADREALEPDDMTRAMQEAMAVSIPDSPRAYVDDNGNVHMLSDFAWTF